MKGVILEYVINGGIIEPRDLGAVIDVTKDKASGIGYDKIFVISGRMPIWMALAIAHELHPARCVAMYDPRLNGGVVIQSHIKDLYVGDVIPVSNFEKVIVEV